MIRAAAFWTLMAVAVSLTGAREAAALSTSSPADNDTSSAGGNPPAGYNFSSPGFNFSMTRSDKGRDSDGAGATDRDTDDSKVPAHREDSGGVFHWIKRHSFGIFGRDD